MKKFGFVNIYLQSLYSEIFGRANNYLAGQKSLYPPNNIYEVTSLIRKQNKGVLLSTSRDAFKSVGALVPKLMETP